MTSTTVATARVPPCRIAARPAVVTTVGLIDAPVCPERPVDLGRRVMDTHVTRREVGKDGVDDGGTSNPRRRRPAVPGHPNAAREELRAADRSG
jgi:hypothetical protein